MKVQEGRWEVYGEIPEDLWQTKKPFIAKLQKPLMGGAEVLVYDETREWSFTCPWEDWLDPVLFEGKLKIYARCWFKKSGQFHIEEIVEEQGW